MRSWALIVATLLSLAAPSRAAVILNLATGFDNSTSTLLPNGSADTKFVIAAGGTGGMFGTTPLARTTPLPNGWMLDSASAASRWIVLPGFGLEGVSVSGGTYLFQTTFNIGNFVDPSSVFLDNLQYAADNRLYSVTINGTAVFTQPQTFAQEFATFHSIGDVGLGLFVSGQNTIQFGLWNQSSVTPMGLRIEGNIVGVPEPASLLLIAPAFLAMRSLIRRKRSAV